MSARILTASNTLTISRLLSIPVVVALMLGHLDRLAAVVFIAAAITDFLDGWLARREGSSPTHLGQILDPIADRLFLSSVAVVLAMRGLLPVWAVAILVVRDLAVLVGGLAFRGRISVNRVGKAATATLMAAVALVVTGRVNAGEILFYAGFVLSMISVLMYVRKISSNVREGA